MKTDLFLAFFLNATQTKFAYAQLHGLLSVDECKQYATGDRNPELMAKVERVINSISLSVKHKEAIQ